MLGHYRCSVRVFFALVSLVPLAPQHIGSGDAVQPRDTQAVIESVAPALPDGVKFTIVGSDTFVRVESKGHDVQVQGYEDEPYLRIDKSGTVQVNDSSQTTVLNSDRYGNVDLTQFKKSDIPKWRTIATNGVAMWHDHRSHWMNPVKPATIDDRGTVLKWTIPITVDGVVTKIDGSLYLRNSASPLWWLIAIVSLLIAAFLAMKHSRALHVLLVLVAVCGVAVGALELGGLPAGARITPILLLFSAGALVLLSIAFASQRLRIASHVSAAMSAGAGGAMLVAVWLCSDQVKSAYVPGLTQEWAARVTLTAMAGVGVVAIVDAYVRIARGSDGE